MSTAHITSLGVGKTPNPPLQPTPWAHPYPHPTQRISLLSPPHLEASLFIFALPAAAETPIKPCLNFLFGLWGQFLLIAVYVCSVISNSL